MRINPSKLIHGAVFLALAFLSACGGGGGGDATAPTLTSIAITPASATIVVASTANLTATGTYSNNSTADITTSVTWTSAAPSTASVGPNTGVVTGVAAGATTVTATLSGITSNMASITVTASPLTGITVTPSSVSIDTGTTTAFTATGTYADLSTGNISGSVTWNSSNTAAATFSGSTATGLSVGSSNITASLDGVTSNTATLNVVAPTLTAIAITPASATMAKGLTASLSATGTYSSGPTADITTSVTLTSAAPSTASVGPNTGVVSGVAVGTTTITASLSGITSPAANITVTAATLTSIAVTPTSISIAKGTTTPFTATGTYTDGTGDISGSVVWNSSTAAATFSGSTATGVSEGSSNITASLSGVTSNTAVLTVTPAVITAIAVTPATPSIAVGSTINLTATATYSDATTADVTTAVNWTSGSTGVATIGLNTGVATGVAAGGSTIFATSPTGGLNGSSVANNPGVTLTVYKTYTIGVTITGAANGIGPILQNNLGDDLFIPAITTGLTSFTFSTPVLDGAAYSVTQRIRAKAPSQDCSSITPVSGTVNGADVTVSITCVLSTVVPKFAFVTNSAADTVSAFNIDGVSGNLTAATPTPTTASGAVPSAVFVDPTGQFAYVTNKDANSVTVYGINPDSGVLTVIDADGATADFQPSIATGYAPMSIAVHPSGKFAYVANELNLAGGNSISAYSINITSGALTAIDADGATDGNQASIATGVEPYAITIDPLGKFAYVANYASYNVSAYTIDQITGALTPVADSPFAAGSNTHSIVIDPTGKYAYAANGGGDISAYSIGGAGALTQIVCANGVLTTCSGSNYVAGSAPRSIAVDPYTGLYAYVANSGGGVSAFGIDPATGALSAIDADAATPGDNLTIAAGSVPISINVDPSGQFVYVANLFSDNISVYSIGVGGALTPLPTLSLSTGSGPTSVTTTQ